MVGNLFTAPDDVVSVIVGTAEIINMKNDISSIMHSVEKTIFLKFI